MRTSLASAAALAVLVALALALWLGRSGREVEPTERRAERVSAQAGEAAELIAGQETDANARAPVAQDPLEPDGDASLAHDDPSCKLIVRVVGEETGAPLQGVPLNHLPWPPQPLPDDFQQEAIETDQHGMATLRVPPGGRQVYTFTQEDRKLVVELMPGEEREEVLSIRSQADHDVHLRIVDARDDAPLDGAEVELECFPEDPTVGVWTATADAQGAVALRVASWINYSAQVSAAGYTTLRVGLGGAHASSEAARRIALNRVARLSGSVTDGAGAPQVGATILAKATADFGFLSAGHEELTDSQWSSRTDTSGAYGLDGLPAGVDLTFEVHRGERLLLDEQTPTRLEAGESGTRDFLVDVAGGIRGIVLDAEGTPMSNQELWLMSEREPQAFSPYEDPVAEAAADEAGRFCFGDVPRGRWLIGPKPFDDPPLGYPMSIGQAVERTEGVTWVEVELRLPAGLFVAGRCVDQEGKPVSGVDVNAFDMKAWVNANTKSAADGTFSVGPLPAGKIGLLASHETMAMEARDTPVEAGDSGVVLRFALAARVRGRVIDAASGTPLSAEVFAAAGGTGQLGNTGPGGDFSFRDLPPGRCVLAARASPQLASHPCSVVLKPGEEAVVDLQVVPGGTVKVLLPEGPEQAGGYLLIDGLQVDWFARDRTTSVVPPGPLTVELRNLSGLLASKRATVAAGETVEVDLR